MLDNLIEFFDSRTWFVMVITLLIVLAYIVMLFMNNPNAPQLKDYFNIIIGFWFGTGATIATINNKINKREN